MFKRLCATAVRLFRLKEYGKIMVFNLFACFQFNLFGWKKMPFGFCTFVELFLGVQILLCASAEANCLAGSQLSMLRRFKGLRSETPTQETVDLSTCWFTWRVFIALS